MKRRRSLIWVIGLVLLAGCAVPADLLTDEDLVMKTSDVRLNYRTAYKNLEEGFRQCQSWFIPDTAPHPGANQDRMVVYGRNLFNVKTRWVYAVIHVKQIAPDRTRVSVGINKHYDDPIYEQRGGGHDRFLRWARGVYNCTPRKPPVKKPPVKSPPGHP